jgi:DNA-binding response OmpR family regulator
LSIQATPYTLPLLATAAISAAAEGILGCSAYQVLWELRRLGCTAPILISSGYSAGGSIQDLVGGPGGADGFLPKPYTMQELSETVRTTLDGIRTN